MSPLTLRWVACCSALSRAAVVALAVAMVTASVGAPAAGSQQTGGNAVTRWVEHAF